MSEQVFDLWFAFDRPLDDGKLVVDRFLAKRMVDLSPGQRLYLQTLRGSSMRLYEVEESRPGESLTLRDLLEDHRVTVYERLGSRSLGRFDWIAARLLAVGASGKPEIEGILPIPDLYHQALRDQLRRERDEFLRIADASVEAFHKTTPPLFQDVWAGALLEPAIPHLANTDGEEMVLTEVRFEVTDREAVQRALDAQEGLERDEDGGATWRWYGKNGKGELVSLGQIKLSEQGLALEANSVVRGERGRALVEGAAGAAVRYRTTVHQDLQRLVREEVRRGARRDEPLGPESTPPSPPEVHAGPRSADEDSGAAAGGLTGPSARPPTCDKGREVDLGNPHGIHDAHVQQPPLVAQLVDGRGAHTEPLRDLAHGQQPCTVGTSRRGEGRASIFPTAFLKHGRSKRPARTCDHLGLLDLAGRRRFKKIQQLPSRCHHLRPPPPPLGAGCRRFESCRPDSFSV